jgi:hypothetical protein
MASESSTLYCAVNDTQLATSIVEFYFPDATKNRDGSIVAHGNRGTIRFSFKFLISRGDEFCRLLLGTRAHILRGSSSDEQQSKFVNIILQSKLLIGIVAEPTLQADPKFKKIIRRLAADLDGILGRVDSIWEFW